MSHTLSSTELAYLDIYEQYVDEASFLWLMHTIAVDQPHYGVSELARLEKRIEVQLNGLMGNLDVAWMVCEQALEDGEAGAVFTSAVLAFRSHDQNKIQAVVEAGMCTDEAYKGLLHALVWLPGNLTHSWIKRFFTSKDIKHKKLAIEVCHSRCENPADFLLTLFQREDCTADIPLYIACLKIVGDLKRIDLSEHVNTAIQHEDETVKFWAIRSAIFLGDKSQVVKLEPYIKATSNLQFEAINIAFRVLPMAEARKWVTSISNDDEQVRVLIIITGVIGNATAIDWLLQKMRETPYARVAAEAFCLITGIDLAEMNLVANAPADFESLLNEDADDENVEMHADENLSWPDVTKIASVWNTIKTDYIPETRYLLGHHIGLLSLKSKLDTAYQRQRHAIACEIALIDRNEKLINTRAKVT
ncbi:hypothetical protein MNBD_GAMMA08-2639 [hydrothermal vent metagenome]|uniref:FOG: HEAT repeat n=1 Tax=hydrothermal vent metagenome TaxID=652676 RepID=A0A3B0WU46_9ZZZZ